MPPWPQAPVGFPGRCIRLKLRGVRPRVADALHKCLLHERSTNPAAPNRIRAHTHDIAERERENPDPPGPGQAATRRETVVPSRGRRRGGASEVLFFCPSSERPPGRSSELTRAHARSEALLLSVEREAARAVEREKHQATDDRERLEKVVPAPITTGDHMSAEAETTHQG